MTTCERCGKIDLLGYEMINMCKPCATGNTDVQQLMAEVAALADKLHFAYEAADMDYKTIADSIEKLRQLSASRCLAKV